MVWEAAKSIIFAKSREHKATRGSLTLCLKKLDDGKADGPN